MKRKLFSLMILVLVATMVLSACSSEKTTPAPKESATPVEETTVATEKATGATEAAPATSYSDKTVIYVTSKPLGTNQFHLMGKKALTMLEEKYGVKTDVYESENDPTNREENIRAAVNAGANVIFVLGTEWNDIVPQVAAKNPDVDFLIADQCVEKQLPNIHCTVFKEHEAAYLLGVMAASLTKADHIGALGALDIPFLHRYTDAFIQGAKSIKPDIKTEIRWVGGDNPFADPARAKEQALAIYATGADQIFSATAGGDQGVFEAAAQNDFFAYGVDVNNCSAAPGKVVDNLLKHIDLAIVDAVGKILTENPDAMYVSVGVAEGAVGAGATDSDPALNKDCVIMQNPEVIKAVKEAQAKIISGEIVVDDPMMAK